MMFLNELKKKTLLIIPSKIKEKILLYIEENNILSSLKILEYENLKKQLYFDYNDGAIEYLKSKYKFKKDICKKYLNNLYFVDNSENENMLFLKQIKEELERSNLLYKNEYFIPYLNQYEIVIFGVDKLNKFDKKMIETLKKYTSVRIIENKKYPINIAYSFPDKEEQIKYIFENISKLLKENILINKIKLSNVNKDDYQHIKRFAQLYKIPVGIEENILYSTKLYNDIKKCILENKLENIESSKYLNQLLTKINNTKNINNLEETLDEYAKEIYIDDVENKIEIVDIKNNYFYNDEYVFILNCNASILPKTYKDEDYLYDKIKPAFMENTYELTQFEEEATIIALNKIKNKTICFIKKDGNTEYFKSPILDNVKIEEPNHLYSSFSNLQNKKDYAKYLDNYYKYGTYNDAISILKNNYEIPYKKYDNSFKRISISTNEHLLISYSSLNSFYECKFKYYLNYILKLKDFNENYSTYLGSLAHYILEKSTSDSFDIDKIIEEYRNNNPILLSRKEELFLFESKNSIIEAINFEKSFKKHTQLTKEENEKKLYVNLKNKNATIMGVIDKKWQDDQNKIAVLDYKTGNTKVNLKEAYHGLSMQLPIYYYLLKNNYKNMGFVGFYIQNILENNFKNIKNKTKEEQKLDSLKWNGYTIDNIELIEKLDSTFKDSRYIKGLKIGKNGFYQYSKLLTKKQLDNLYDLTDKKINEMIDDVRKNNFQINPKRIKGENISCKFCPYKSICFMKEEDIIELEDIKTLEFLGDDLNA